MEPEQWQRVKALFASALERPPEERQSFLDGICGEDVELRSEVASLLSSDDSAGDFIEHPPQELNSVLDQSRPSNAEIGKRVGAYELIREIGFGGMGTVYLAFRADAEFQKHVAVKLIRKGMESDLVVERFRKERQILARLEHANIARLIDAGACSDGQPYLVMEYVEGEPINVYCEGRRLSVRERVALFRDVCRAVQCAHQSLIVHRDLKPSNVLVTRRGDVKLLDFGIAKLLHPEQNDVAPPTRTGVQLMTPEYASPEQIRGEAVTTVSDIYSMGVILYQLLTGENPYSLKNRSMWEVHRAVCEEDPVKPSVAVSEVKGMAIRDGKQNQDTRPKTISRQLRGDLDNIVLKAIAKEPSRRYQSAEALSEDLKRFLHGEPVTAHPLTLAYRAVKFSRRHRTAVFGTVFLFISLTAGVVATSEQARRAEHERERAETSLRSANRERARADNEAASARAVNDFLRNDLLAQASASIQARPDTKPDPDLRVRTALDRAAQRLTGKFRNQPLVEASIRQTIGDTYSDLGLYPEAQVQMERALGLRRRVLGDENPDTLNSMHKLGLVLWYRARYTGAEQLFNNVVARWRQTRGDNHPETLSAMNDLALAYWYEGNYAEAEPLFTRVLEARRRLLGEEHADVLSSMNNLAGLYVHQGHYQPAEPLFTKVLEARARLLGPEHPDTLLSMNNLAVVYWDQGKYPNAETLLASVLQTKQRVLGPDHPETLSTMNNLAGVYREEGRCSEAGPLFVRVLQVRRRVLGPEHAHTLISMNNLALLYQCQAKYPQAESLLKQTLEARQRTLGPEHPDTLISINNLAFLYSVLARYELAEPLYTRLIGAQARVLGASHPRRLAAMNDLAALYFDERKYDSAEPLLREALKSYQNANLVTWLRYRCESLLGATVFAQKRYSEAEPLLRSGYQGITRLRQTLPWERRFVLKQAADWMSQLRESSRTANTISK